MMSGSRGIFIRPFHLSWLLSSLFLTAIVGGLACISWMANDHLLIFPLDDSYIHLAIVRQLLEHHTWGLSPDSFQSASSSPLYTLILTAFAWVVGVREWLPLVINLLAGFGVLYTSHRFIFSGFRTKHSLTLALWTLLLLAPLPLLVLCGMEHTLQVWIDLAFVQAVLHYLFQRGNNRFYSVLFLAILVPFIRYEGMFLIIATAITLVLGKKIKAASLIMIAGSLPIIGFGVFSLQKMGSFFPTSILGKGHLPGIALSEIMRWVLVGLSQIYDNPFILILLLTLLFILVIRSQTVSFLQDQHGTFAFLLLLTTLAHVFWASIGGYRYEAYLIVPGIVLVLISIPIIPKTNLRIFPIQRFGFLPIFIGFFLLPFLIRAGFFYLNYQKSTQNIYQQQYQMAQFLRTYYPEASVAANDIGAISYFADIQLTDLVGIGDVEISRLRRSGKYTRQHIEALVKKRDVNIAVVHDIWVGQIIPKSWIQVERWTIPDNFICADPTVSWYASDPENAGRLSKHLQQFASQLPAPVVRSGTYHE